MGQYHYVVNLDKKEYLYPSRFSDGLKLLEFGSGGTTMTALAVLLAAQCVGGSRGGGDIASSSPLVGSWAGDRIAIIGDYAEHEDAVGWDKQHACALQETIDQGDGGEGDWKNISGDVLALLQAAGEESLL